MRKFKHHIQCHSITELNFKIPVSPTLINGRTYFSELMDGIIYFYPIKLELNNTLYYNIKQKNYVIFNYNSTKDNN